VRGDLSPRRPETTLDDMDRLREWELAERAAVAAERLAANLDGIDAELGTVRHAREKARILRERADDLMAAIVDELGTNAAERRQRGAGQDAQS
jgi:uncharacterized membrane protein